jgi:hypothetical protein
VGDVFAVVHKAGMLDWLTLLNSDIEVRRRFIINESQSLRPTQDGGIQHNASPINEHPDDE